MNDEQIQMIEVVMAEHLAGCAQHIGKGMARDGSDQIRGGFLIFACANHLKNPISANGLGPTLHVPEQRRLPSRGWLPAISGGLGFCCRTHPALPNMGMATVSQRQYRLVSGVIFSDRSLSCCVRNLHPQVQAPTPIPLPL